MFLYVSCVLLETKKNIRSIRKYTPQKMTATPIIAATALSFTLTLALTPAFISFFRKNKITGMDGHKPDKPETPEMGGTAITLAYTLAIASTATLFGILNPQLDLILLLSPLAVFLLASAVGAVDDLHKLHHHEKPLLLVFCSAPIIILSAGNPILHLPFFPIDFTNLLGVNLAIIYWIIIVPLGVTGAANLVNMLAGFNGIMTLPAAIASGAMAIITHIQGNQEATILFAAMAAAQLAFLKFNWTPAKIFPGDVGTLGFGAFYAAAIITADIEVLGLIALAPQFINAAASLLSVGSFFEEKQFRKEKMAAFKLHDDGKLEFIKVEKPITLCKLLLYNKPQKESTLVLKVGALSTISSLTAVILMRWMI